MNAPSALLLLCVALGSSAIACDSKKEEPAKSEAKAAAKTDAKAEAKAGDVKEADAKEADAPADGGEVKADAPSFASVDALVAGAKSSEDFDNILQACLSLGIDMAMAKKIEDIDSDPEYWAHCKVGPTRARAQLAIKESTPDKMSVQCLSASMGADEIRDAGKNDAEVEEFKALAIEVNKACGM